MNTLISLKGFLKKILKEHHIEHLRRFDNLRKGVKRRVFMYKNRHNLIKLATLFGTDKWNSHWYAQHYQRYFNPLRSKRLNILEIGVGGYGDPNEGGHSLRMWKEYFPNSMIYGIDICDKGPLQEKRIKIFQGSQDDSYFLRNVVNKIGKLNIVIDDGSHLNRHVIETFQILFPLLDEKGIYIIEDTQTSYWPGYGGSSHDLNDPKTTMGYFKNLIDGLNHKEMIKPGYSPSYFDRHIVAIHFYHNLIFIFKGDNNERGFSPDSYESPESALNVNHETAASRPLDTEVDS
jgi:hypothetical protein